jgi:hypothetical protein
MASTPGGYPRKSLLHRPGWALGSLLLVGALAVAACGKQGEEQPSATTSPSPESTATEVAAASATPNPEIDQVDFSQVQAVKDLLEMTGGRLLPQEVIFADLTGDGSDEAVVPISSGGTGGNIAYAVFGYRAGYLQELLVANPAAGRVMISIEDGMLVDTQPVYAPEDPLCCPSQLQHTYYRWDGSRFVVDHQETEKEPSAKP